MTRQEENEKSWDLAWPTEEDMEDQSDEEEDNEEEKDESENLVVVAARDL